MRWTRGLCYHWTGARHVTAPLPKNLQLFSVDRHCLSCALDKMWDVRLLYGHRALEMAPGVCIVLSVSFLAESCSGQTAALVRTVNWQLFTKTPSLELNDWNAGLTHLFGKQLENSIFVANATERAQKCGAGGLERWQRGAQPKEP